MPERIIFQGKNATAGTCRGCKSILIITDKDATGAYETFHEDPLCQWYIDGCSEPETTTYTGLHLLNKDNVEFKAK